MKNALLAGFALHILSATFHPIQSLAKQQWIRVSDSFVVDYNSLRESGRVRTVEVLQLGSKPSVSLFNINCESRAFSVTNKLGSSSWRAIPGGSAVDSIAVLVCPK